MSAEGSSGSRRNTVIRPGDSGPGEQDDLYSTSPKNDKPRTRMAESTFSISSLQLPSYQKLKGVENYDEFKQNMMNLAISAGLEKYYITDPTRPKPKEITAENYKDSTRDERLDWDDWKTGDAKAKLVLTWNVLAIPARVIKGKLTAVECWDLLRTTYEGSGGTLVYSALVEVITMKCKAYSSTQNFTIAFREAINRLDTLQAPLLPIHAVNIFLFAVVDSYPVWAERQRAALRINSTPDLEGLIADLLNENRSRNANQKVPSSSSSALLKKDEKEKGTSRSR